MGIFQSLMSQLRFYCKVSFHHHIFMCSNHTCKPRPFLLCSLSYCPASSKDIAVAIVHLLTGIRDLSVQQRFLCPGVQGSRVVVDCTSYWEGIYMETSYPENTRQAQLSCLLFQTSPICNLFQDTPDWRYDSPKKQDNDINNGF